jgi:hypothetical protein
MGNCSKCQTYIDDSRNMCDAHYQEALSDYEHQYQQCLEDQEWHNNASYEQRKDADIDANIDNLVHWMVPIGFGIGAFIWFTQKDNPNFPWWHGVLTCLFMTVIYCAIDIYLFRQFLTRTVRTFAMALAYAVLGVIVLFFIQYCIIFLCSILTEFSPVFSSIVDWINSIPTNSKVVLYYIISFLFCLIAGFRGGYVKSFNIDWPTKPIP